LITAGTGATRILTHAYDAFGNLLVKTSSIGPDRDVPMMSYGAPPGADPSPHRLASFEFGAGHTPSTFAVEHGLTT
jgi:hypothetical protein